MLLSISKVNKVSIIRFVKVDVDVVLRHKKSFIHRTSRVFSFGIIANLRIIRALDRVEEGFTPVLVTRF